MSTSICTVPCPSRTISMTPCLTFMCRLKLPLRVNLLEQYGHLNGLLSEWRCMWPSRLYIRLNSLPQTWKNNPASSLISLKVKSPQIKWFFEGLTLRNSLSLLLLHEVIFSFISTLHWIVCKSTKGTALLQINCTKQWLKQVNYHSNLWLNILILWC